MGDAANDRYYLSVLRQAMSHSATFVNAQGLVTSLGLAVLGMFVDVAYHVHQHQGWGAAVNDIGQLVLSGVIPVMLLAAIIFIYHLVRAPAELAALRRSEYAMLEREADDLRHRLSAQQMDLSLSIEYWGQLTGAAITAPTNVIFQITVRNSGPPTALSDWKLEIPSVTTEPVSPRRDPWQEMVFKNLRDARTGAQVLTDLLRRTAQRLDTGEIAQGTIMFDLTSLSRSIVGDETLRATLTCLDARGDKHCIQSQGAAVKIG
jgi:hypothetical protein